MTAGVIPVLAVPTYRRADLLLRLLDSIDHPVGHLVIIDNGHQGIDSRFLPGCCERATVSTMPGNLGVAGSWNLAIKATAAAPWWLIVNDDAWFPAGALARIARHAREDAVGLADVAPPWACFTLGADVVRRVGLFDERFHPAYFEDTDYERRCDQLGVPVHRIPVRVMHANSSTIAVDGAGNARTFGPNAELHRIKAATGDLSWTWDIDRTRTLAWE